MYQLDIICPSGLIDCASRADSSLTKVFWYNKPYANKHVYTKHVIYGNRYTEEYYWIVHPL